MSRPPGLALGVLSACSLSSLAFAAPYEPIVVEKSLCSEDRSIENTLCHMGRRRLKVEQAQKQTGGWTLTNLRKRSEDQRSHLVPAWQLVPSRVDLRPQSVREQAVQKKRQSILEKRGDLAEEETNLPLLRRRAKSGLRGGVLSQVCGRRHGLQLIACLTELGIEISPRTADEATLKLYEEQQAMETEE